MQWAAIVARQIEPVRADVLERIELARQGAAILESLARFMGVRRDIAPRFSAQRAREVLRVAGVEKLQRGEAELALELQRIEGRIAACAACDPVFVVDD